MIRYKQQIKPSSIVNKYIEIMIEGIITGTSAQICLNIFEKLKE